MLAVPSTASTRHRPHPARLGGLGNGGGSAAASTRAAGAAAVPVSRLAAVPAGVPDVQAAALPAAGLTALRALAIGGLVPGRRVLVTGAAGGVGRMAVQLARASGADVTALVRDAAASGGLMRSLGAAAVAGHLGGEFDVIIDGAGGATSGLAIGHLRPRGAVVNIATQDDEDMVRFRAEDFDRARRDDLHAESPGRARVARQCSR
jgi:NADPH2:quinone reductase